MTSSMSLVRALLTGFSSGFSACFGLLSSGFSDCALAPTENITRNRPTTSDLFEIIEFLLTIVFLIKAPHSKSLAVTFIWATQIGYAENRAAQSHAYS
jgi:hypothetical protein